MNKLLALLLVLAGCSAEVDPCSEARAQVAACYGAEEAAALDGTCSDAIAAEILATPCDDSGKSDSGPPLPATLTCGTTSPGFAKIDVGGGVALHTACQGSGPTILLLHGWPESWLAWRTVMADLAPSYRVIAPDLRGYNLSSRPSGESNYRFELYLDDVVTLLETVGDGPVIVVGHDVGGFLAWFLAHARPDLVRGLAIINASHPDVLRELLATSPAQREALTFWNVLNVFQWPALIGGFFYDQLIATAFAHHTSTAAQPRSVLSRDDQALYRDSWQRAKVPWRHAMVTMIDGYKANLDHGPKFAGDVPGNLSITMPTLVMWGLHDIALLADLNLPPLASHVAKLRVERFPDAGHFVVHEAPHDIARLIDGLARDPEAFVR